MPILEYALESDLNRKASLAIAHRHGQYRACGGGFSLNQASPLHQRCEVTLTDSEECLSDRLEVVWLRLSVRLARCHTCTIAGNDGPSVAAPAQSEPCTAGGGNRRWR